MTRSLIDRPASQFGAGRFRLALGPGTLRSMSRIYAAISVHHWHLLIANINLPTFGAHLLSSPR